MGTQACYKALGISFPWHYFWCFFICFGFAKVERRRVDRFSDRDVFLPCVVRAEWADGGDSPPEPLFCELKFHGAAEGFDFITIQSPQGCLGIQIKVVSL